jgi:hypothetical protein
MATFAKSWRREWAAPDGYTLLHMTATNAFNATLYDNLNFNFIRDIAPVAGIDRVAYGHLEQWSILPRDGAQCRVLFSI